MPSREYNIAWNKKNKERRRELNVKHRLLRYGMTVNDYERMLQEQKGKCAICGDIRWSLLFVDHDHETGEVRGLLCDACNGGIGFLGDSIEVLELALSYLRKHARKKSTR